MLKTFLTTLIFVFLFCNVGVCIEEIAEDITDYNDMIEMEDNYWALIILIYICPIHGEIDETITFHSGGTEIKYCSKCFSEMLDRNGVERLEERED